MKKILSLLLAFAMCFSLASCAATPEKPVVMQKDQEQLVETANSLEDTSSTIRSQTNPPERMTGSFETKDKTFSVNMDAEVILPNADNAKIIRMGEQKFSKSDVKAFIHYLFGDSQLYQYGSLIEETQEDVQKDILRMQKELAELKEKGDANSPSAVPAEGEGKYEEEEYQAPPSYAEELEEQIAFAQEHLSDFPKERTPIPAKDSDFDGIDTYLGCIENGEFPNVVVDQHSGTHYLGFQKPKTDAVNATIYANTYEEILIEAKNYPDEAAFQTIAAEAIGKLPEPAVTQEEALKQAEGFAALVGIDFRCVKSEPALIHTDYSDIKGNQKYELEKGWKIRFSHFIDEIPVSVVGRWGASPEDGESWMYESLVFAISDRGIVSVELNEPYNVKETLVENCKLLPFEEIQSVFEKMMVVTHGPETYYSGFEFYESHYDISRVEFGYSRITEVNQKMSGLLIPTWSFYGSMQERSQFPGDELSENIIGEMEIPVLVINAIDGSVIDLNKGY